MKQNRHRARQYHRHRERRHDDQRPDAIHDHRRELGCLPRLGLPQMEAHQVARHDQRRRHQKPHRHDPPPEAPPEESRQSAEHGDQGERADAGDGRINPLPLEADQESQAEGNGELEEGVGDHRVSGLVRGAAADSS